MKSDYWKMSAFGVLLISATLAAPAGAADPKFYAEVGVGRSNVSDDSVSIDENTTGFRLAAGYQINPWFGVDVGFVNFGTFETDFDENFDPPVPLEASAQGLELGLTGRVPLGDKFAVTGRASMLWWDSDISIGGISESDSGNDFTYGIGVEMALNRTFVVTAAWEKVGIEDTDVDLVTLGFRMRFGGGTSN